ncbi:unnamed protein product [Cuscuta europaea]|uniref:EamA domain-containing protein n=1 Tax=Cuscuta europaea TaxID=41803 RepID=A0A9P1DYB5_CUSEU|nr:unnamed protein product [Cuscuta europaea]
MALGESMNGGIAALGGGDIEDGHLMEFLEAIAPVGHPSGVVAEATDASVDTSDDQITPLLPKPERSKINIFTITYPKRESNKEEVKRSESDRSPFLQFILWAWSGSKYSGLLCMAFSSVIYCIMDVVSDIFSVQSISLFEMAFTRCTLLLIISLVWLKRTRQPIFGLKNVTTLLVLRAVIGYLSLLSFIYCIQRLPLSQAVVLSFTTPIVAAVGSRFILHEKMNLAEIGGLASSFFGVLFLFQPMISSEGALLDIGEANASYVNGYHHSYAVLVGLCSSIAGGISYCLIRAGAKTTDQPVVTVFSFGLFASPAAGICTFAFEKFVLPSCYSLFLMIVLGVLAFFAEITLARGLQLEKTSRAVNVLYIEAALSQLLRMGSSRIASFSKLVGCSLILISASFTLISCGPE